MGLFFWKKKKEEVSYVLDQSMEMPVKQEKAVQSDTAKTASQPVATNEIPPEVIAVIAAAVTVTLGAGARILSVRRAENKRGRAAWSMAGLLENTRPF
ncbi:MAG: hypothetical protein IJH64_02725 [Oscillospiraceae bacterium]|nr:hypothetical protein [Oscillospiraceae bacterium]